MNKKRFTVTFVKWDELTPNMCDFCNDKAVVWWCEFLCEGYCDKCMKEQEEEYKSEM